MTRHKEPIRITGIAPRDGKPNVWAAGGVIGYWGKEVDGPAAACDGRSVEVRVTRTELAAMLGALPAIDMHEDLLQAYLTLKRYLESTTP